MQWKGPIAQTLLPICSVGCLRVTWTVRIPGFSQLLIRIHLPIIWPFQSCCEKLAYGQLVVQIIYWDSFWRFLTALDGYNEPERSTGLLESWTQLGFSTTQILCVFYVAMLLVTSASKKHRVFVDKEIDCVILLQFLRKQILRKAAECSHGVCLYVQKMLEYHKKGTRSKCSAPAVTETSNWTPWSLQTCTVRWYL